MSQNFATAICAVSWSLWIYPHSLQSRIDLAAPLFTNCTVLVVFVFVVVLRNVSVAFEFLVNETPSKSRIPKRLQIALAVFNNYNLIEASTISQHYTTRLDKADSPVCYVCFRRLKSTLTRGHYFSSISDQKLSKLARL
jgi:dolichyl-phosphate-mannose--protein O-mannosyl transferase